MTLKDEIADLRRSVNSLNTSVQNLRKDFRDYQGFVIQCNLDMMTSIRDLHDRLQYIKTYIGCDEFFKACSKEQNDSNNTPT